MARAFEILKEKYKIPHKLVLAGRPGYGYEKIRAEIASSQNKDEIIFPGFVKDEEKFSLIQKSDVFLFPTFYEGFGIPVLEAQSAGVPVVTSNVSSLPEVANGPVKSGADHGTSSAVLVDPNEPEFIAERTYALISDKELRNDIIKKGYENVKRFSWEKCAKEIAEILNEK